MKFLIKKIIKESDFDWINDVPSFIEITEPVTQKNPKNVFRLHWINGHGEDYGIWANNWQGFKNDSDGINRLTRYIQILQNGITRRGELSTTHLTNLYFKGGHDYIVTDWMKNELNGISEYDKEDSLIEMLSRFIVSGLAPTLGISINGLAPS